MSDERVWRAEALEEPEENPDHPEDPQDWEFRLVLIDESEREHESIFVTFTGTVDDNSHVTPTPEDEVDQRISAMLDGLNADLKAAK
jgi:hypothetical protein